MTRLSSWVLWLSPPKGCSPNSSWHWYHSLPPFFGQMVVASEKVRWRIAETILYIHLSPKWLLLHKCYLEGSADCALHLSPSLLLGSKLHELLTCLTHINPVRRKRPIMSLLLGVFFGRIFWKFTLKVLAENIFFSLTLPETNIAPENRPSQKETKKSSNHPFSGALAVSFREGI